MTNKHLCNTESN